MKSVKKSYHGFFGYNLKKCYVRLKRQTTWYKIKCYASLSDEPKGKTILDFLKIQKVMKYQNFMKGQTFVTVFTAILKALPAENDKIQQKFRILS